MSNNNSTTLPILPILGLIFITLKFTGHITWPWFWVLSPFWIPVAIVLLIVVIVILLAYRIKK